MGGKSLSEQASVAAWNQNLKVPSPGYCAFHNQTNGVWERNTTKKGALIRKKEVGNGIFL